MNKEKYEKGYIQAYIDYDRLINNGYTKEDALFELDYLCPYFPQFEDTKRQKYVVIKTSYGKGYQQGLIDIDNGTYEKEKLITRYEPERRI